MFVITKTVELDAGHRIPFHDSKCRHLHGHRYRVTATVAGEYLVAPDLKASTSGMLMDFGNLKQILMERIVQPFDHKFLLWEEDELVDVLDSDHGVVYISMIPTAEGLARLWFGLVNQALNIPGLRLVALEVQETPTAKAVYSP